MATFTLTGTGERYPQGTTVAVYPRANVIPGQAPSGVAVTSAIASAQSVAFSALEFDTAYAAYALVAGEHRYTSFRTDSGVGASSAAAGMVPFDQPGVLRVGVGAGRFRFPVAVRLLSVAATAGGAPSGTAIIVDVNANGSTVFTTQAGRPSIAAGANASADATPDVVSVEAGGYLTVDIDQVGSTFPGSDLSVLVRYIEV